MTKEEIGKVIKDSRLAAGLTQAQVAEKLGRPQQTIAGWEVGRSQPDANTLFELFAILGQSIDRAFGYTDKSPFLSVKAMKIARCYDTLDDYGKDIVDLIVKHETTRCIQDRNLKNFTNYNPSYQQILGDVDDESSPSESK